MILRLAMSRDQRIGMIRLIHQLVKYVTLPTPSCICVSGRQVPVNDFYFVLRMLESHPSRLQCSQHGPHVS